MLNGTEGTHKTTVDSSIGQAIRDGVARAAAVIGLAGVALIHLLDAPGSLQDGPYKNWLYVALILGCVKLDGCCCSEREGERRTRGVQAQTTALTVRECKQSACNVADRDGAAVEEAGVEEGARVLSASNPKAPQDAHATISDVLEPERRRRQKGGPDGKRNRIWPRDGSGCRVLLEERRRRRPGARSR